MTIETSSNRQSVTHSGSPFQALGKILPHLVTIRWRQVAEQAVPVRWNVCRGLGLAAKDEVFEQRTPGLARGRRQGTQVQDGVDEAVEAGLRMHRNAR